jgi:hypothetical protein
MHNPLFSLLVLAMIGWAIPLSPVPGTVIVESMPDSLTNKELLYKQGDVTASTGLTVHTGIATEFAELSKVVRRDSSGAAPNVDPIERTLEEEVEERAARGEAETDQDRYELYRYALERNREEGGPWESLWEDIYRIIGAVKRGRARFRQSPDGVHDHSGE